MKKGLSGIVTSVLLVLIALMAIGIIWNFTRPFVDETSKAASVQDCLSSDISAVRCIYSGNNSQGYYATLLMRRGPDSINLAGIKIIFESANRATKTLNWENKIVGGPLPNPYETSTAGFSLGNFFPQTVALAPLIGENMLCNPQTKLACTKYAIDGSTLCADFDTDGFLDGDDYSQYVGCYETETNQNRSAGLCMYNPPSRRQKVDMTEDGGVTIDDFDAFIAAFIAGGMSCNYR